MGSETGKTGFNISVNNINIQMKLSYKYRLQPTSTQVRILEEQLNLCRWVYNTLLDHCYNERRTGRGTPTHKSLTYLLPAMKTETPELGKVHSQVLQNVAYRIRRGFEGYWARRRAGLRADTPHFVGSGDYKSLTYPQFGFKLNGLTLMLSKVGALKIILHRPLEGVVKTLTVKREPSGKWYAVFSCEVENKPVEGRLPAVGVDFGLKSIIALSDGTIIEAPQFYRKSEERLGRLQRIHSRRKLGSRNRERARIILSRAYEGVANQRRDFLNKIARGIVNRYERVYIEDLEIDNLRRNRRLSKSIGDAGWRILRHSLIYMAQRSLGVTVCVDSRNTSQLCSGCGEVVPKDLAERTHACPHCGLVLDRDVNAARVILRKGIGMECAESTPVGDSASTEGAIPVTQVGLMNQEAHLFRGG
jgi:putative transposase